VVQFKEVGTRLWNVPDGVTSVEYLIVAGGGGGSNGGGGAGGLLAGSFDVSSIPNSSIVVGGGGAGVGSTERGGIGGDSAALGLNAKGGGGGGADGSGAVAPGGSGGSGGGAGDAFSSPYDGGAALLGGVQGKTGGKSAGLKSTVMSGGGGGGAGLVGADGTSSAGGKGGNGTTSAIIGTSTSYAGGGGGGISKEGGGGSGGSGGGGAGGSFQGAGVVAAQSGQANRGGGGGGSSNRELGGAGGSGIVILRYEVPLLTQSPLYVSVAAEIFTYPEPVGLETSGGSGEGAVTFSKISGNCTLEGNVLTPTSAGDCVVTATKAGDDTYAPITSAQQAISFAKASRTASFLGTPYGGQVGSTVNVSSTLSAGVGDGALTYSKTGDACSIADPAVGAVQILSFEGTCTVTATFAEGTNYLSASVSTEIALAKRTLFVAAPGASVNFGSSFQTNITYTGLLPGDSVPNSDDDGGGVRSKADSSGHTGVEVIMYEGVAPVVYGPTTSKPVNAGVYNVYATNADTSGLVTASNYVFSFPVSQVVISRVSRALAFTSTSATIQYGDSFVVSAAPSAGDGALSYTVTSGTCTIAAGSAEVVAGAAVGSCNVSGSIAQGTNHLSANTSTPVTVNMTKRQISIQADDVSVASGEAVAATFTVTESSLVGSDALEVEYTYEGTGSTVYAATTSAPTAIGTYSVTPASESFTVGLAGNYDITFLAGTLSITAFVAAVTPPSSNPPQSVTVANVPSLQEQTVSRAISELVEVTLRGTHLDRITRVSLENQDLKFSVTLNGTRLSVVIPNAATGQFDLVLVYQGGSLVQAVTLVEPAQTSKVTAASFNGAVVVYAKGYEGSRLSVRVGSNWIVVPSLRSDFVRVVQPVGRSGVMVKVQIFINRKLVDMSDLVTR
jgi:hypothetical protein